MLLGLYWDELPPAHYQFEYFQFKPAVLGHANIPPALTAHVLAKNPKKLFNDIKALWEKYPQALTLEYKINNDQLYIEISDYALYDFDFAFALSIENIFKQYTVKPTSNTIDIPYLYLKSSHNRYSEKKPALLQCVFGYAKHNNARVSELRLDTHVSALNKKMFIEAVKNNALTSGITVCFYKEHKCEGYFNLMFFFTLGHQGLNLSSFTKIDIEKLEVTLEKSMNQFESKKGFELKDKNLDLYPKSEPQFLLLNKDEPYFKR
ncbi:hypothetical protein K1X76_09575 [bacterium]|nr:hypothetical protein [bacterium]